jgi:hypothetical protein
MERRGGPHFNRSAGQVGQSMVRDCQNVAGAFGKQREESMEFGDASTVPSQKSQRGREHEPTVTGKEKKPQKVGQKEKGKEGKETTEKKSHRSQWTRTHSSRQVRRSWKRQQQQQQQQRHV